MANHIPKKFNIENFILNGILWDELNQFYKKSITESDGDNLFTKRFVHWKQQINKELKIIGSNPTKELTQVRLRDIRKNKDCTDKMYYAIIDHLKEEFEHNMNLGNTDAYIYLSNMKVRNVNPITFNTFKFKGDLERFYKQCVEYKVIDKEIPLDSFKIAFNGENLIEFTPFKFNFKQNNHNVYFFDKLKDKGHIDYRYVDNNKVIEALTGITIASKHRDKYQNSKTGKPLHTDYIDNLVGSLKR
jgi:hypothetical protein